MTYEEKLKKAQDTLIEWMTQQDISGISPEDTVTQHRRFRKWEF